MTAPRTLTARQIRHLHAGNASLRCPSCAWAGRWSDLVRDASGERACPECGGKRFQIVAYAPHPAEGQA